MAMAAPTRMNMWPLRMTPKNDLLTLTHWLSPAFPVGAFAYSHGLETAIQTGVITGPDTLQDWLWDVLMHGSGRNDCILLRAAYACKTHGALLELNAWARALSASKERLMEAELQGTAFSKTVTAIWGGDLDALCYPVALGAAASKHHINVDMTATLYLHAFAGNLVSAAIRAVPLGQTEGHGVIAALTELCAQIADETQTATLDDLSSTAFLSDIAAMQHETLQPRIFRS